MPAYKSAEFVEDTDDELEMVPSEGAVKLVDVEMGGPDRDVATTVTSKASESASALNKRRRIMPDGEGKFIPW